ncbi:MAG: acyltransferase family protein [Gemmobacter sp.]|uniref:acyltransferase family protein n=1 Tax=Gemmobacter sp. TaxID=1898957 RepID=UPI001A3C0093|nr:acyltransferase family protein [Gemmobacter sp.]MBL8562944.1 acyltransferase family protein [Gemmobacter sp.]
MVPVALVAPAVVPPATDRLAGLDLGRFLAAFGIVLTHALVSPTDWVGNLSLGYFHILTGWLAAQSAMRAGAYPLRRRFWRLALPFLAWSAFYLPVEWWIADAAGRAALLGNPMLLLTGPSLHLWYLPFLILSLPLVWPLVQATRGARGQVLASAGLVLLGVPLMALHGGGGLPVPLPQWAFGLPLFAAGIVMARAEALSLAALAAMGAAGWALTGAWWAAPMGLGAGLLCAALRRLPLAALPWQIGRTAFGIYLLHPFMALFVYKALGTGVHWAPLTLLSFAASWGATVLLLRLPLLRALV